MARTYRNFGHLAIPATFVRALPLLGGTCEALMIYPKTRRRAKRWQSVYHQSL